MIIDVTGFGWSGSGACLDLLSEYSDVQFPGGKNHDWEFTLIHCVDGILDLDYKLNEKKCRIFDSDIAIRRFRHIVRSMETMPEFKYAKMFNGKFEELCNQYIKELVNIRFYSRTYNDLLYPVRGDKLIRFLNRVIDILTLNRISRKLFGSRLNEKYRKVNEHLIEVSYNPDNFIEATKKLIEELFQILKQDDRRPIVMNHLLSPDCPTKGIQYFSEPLKSLVVKRDPRDTYILAKKVLRGAPIPTNDVNDFIRFYKKTIEEPCEDINSDDVLILQFEDLIYEYQPTKKAIEDFLGIKDHNRPLSKFKPSVSIGNTQLFNHFNEFASDVEKIKKELSKSLYSFENRSYLKESTMSIF